MTVNALVQMGIFVGLLLALVKPLGWFMAEVLEGRWPREQRWLHRAEHWIYRLASIDPTREMTWKGYAFAVLLFNALVLCHA